MKKDLPDFMYSVQLSRNLWPVGALAHADADERKLKKRVSKDCLTLKGTDGGCRRRPEPRAGSRRGPSQRCQQSLSKLRQRRHESSVVFFRDVNSQQTVKKKKKIETTRGVGGIQVRLQCRMIPDPGPRTPTPPATRVNPRAPLGLESRAFQGSEIKVTRLFRYFRPGALGIRNPRGRHLLRSAVGFPVRKICSTGGHPEVTIVLRNSLAK